MASVIAINFIGEWTAVQKVLPGFMNRYVLISWRAPATSWNCAILFFLHATPCCHRSSTLCVTVSPMPHFLMAAAMPEYSTVGAVFCACGGAGLCTTVPCIPACGCAGQASLSSPHCGGMPAGSAWSVPLPPYVNGFSPCCTSSCTPPLGRPNCPVTFGADALSSLSTSAQDRSLILVEDRLGFWGDVRPDGLCSPPLA